MARSEAAASITPLDSTSLAACQDSHSTSSAVTESRKAKGWKSVILTGSITSFIVFLINLTITLAATLSKGRHPHDTDGSVVLYSGDCSTTRDIDIGIHLFINVMSTLLLSASNYGMQCLSAPVRAEVDRAHRNGKWMNIGVLSLRNLTKIHPLRTLLWAVLGFASLPLHLFYNSTVFSSIDPHNYKVISAYEDLLHVNNTMGNPDPGRSTLTDQIQLYYTSVSDRLKRVNTSDCIKQYATPNLIGHGDVILVTKNDRSGPLHEPSTYLTWDYSGQVGCLDNPYSWICDQLREPYDYGCLHHNSSSCAALIPTLNTSDWRPRGLKVDYCLVQPLEETCQVRFSSILAVIVVVSNFIKAVTLLITYLVLRQDPLLTIGDAISSFLQNQDPTTKSFCWLDRERINLWQHQCREPALDSSRPHALDHKLRRWSSVVSKTRWSLLVTTYILVTGVCIGLLVFGLTASDWKASTLMGLGFGAKDYRSFISWHLPTEEIDGLMVNVLIANSPQLVLSIIYFTYNGLFTCFLLGQEWHNYAKTRKSLRVSTKPSGAQRSTYYLQLPYRYAVPLMAMSALLHWLVSQSLFLVAFLFFVDWRATYNPSYYNIRVEQTQCGYSPSAILATTSMGIVMLAFAIGVGRRTFPESSMPMAGSCSVAISAACHFADEEDGVTAATSTLQWGQLASDRGSSSTGHCCFSSKDVCAPEPGRLYSGYR